MVDRPQLIAGRYRIDEPLGAGGMGVVHAGHDLRLDRPVAVKLLHHDLTRDPSLQRRFEREARAAACVTHPNAVAIYDTGDDDAGGTFIVMERLTGQTLRQQLDDGPLDEARLREVGIAVLGALRAAHQEGLVHRDVKPGNILVAADGTLKVGDFGIATSLEPGDSTTRVPLGTPAYTAPERLHGFAATERSDLFSLGVVLYEAAAGVRPFGGDGVLAVAESVVAGSHPSLAEHRPDLSPELVAVVERALATDPADRYASADEMLAALVSPPAVAETATLPSSPSATATLAPPVRNAAPPPSVAVRRSHVTRRAIAAIVVVLVLVVIGAVALLGARGDDGRPPASTVPVTAASTVPTAIGSPVPESLARALDRLEEVTQP
jgi:serine/threonine protein kinase